MKKTVIGVGVILVAVAGFGWDQPAQAAGACSYITNDLQDSFYAYQWDCQQSRINDMWSRFHMSPAQWSGGWWGYDDPCNDSKPLKRTFNALQLLAYGVTASPTCNTSAGNIATWAYCWAGNNIDELTASCATDARATTPIGPVIDNKTELKIPFFLNETVAQRAGTIVHEARHANGWCIHKTYPCSNINSCEPSFTTSGCVGVGSSSGYGSYGFQALWLNWFATTARSGWINPTIRADAVAEGNRILQFNFSTPTCWRLDMNGYFYKIC